MVWIAPGSFLMGSPAAEPGRKASEGPQTQVALTQGYWLGQDGVTIGQWKVLMGAGVCDQLIQMLHDDTLYDFPTGPKRTVRAYMNFSAADPDRPLANQDDNLPMYYISWNDAMRFCQKLTAREQAAGRQPAGYEYTLPSEAQWEYACRVGTITPTFAGPARAEVVGKIAWYGANSTVGYVGKGFNNRAGIGPRATGVREPNPWGLVDMAGDVWEWCRDYYAPNYPGGSLTDPTGPASGTQRANRGGSFGSDLASERSSARAQNPPAEASAYRGFRLALCAVR